jgi:hypothetical protein
MAETVDDFMVTLIGALSQIKQPQYNFDIEDVRELDRDVSDQGLRNALRLQWGIALSNPNPGANQEMDGTLNVRIEGKLDFERGTEVPSTKQTRLLARDIAKAVTNGIDWDATLMGFPDSLTLNPNTGEDITEPTEGCVVDVSLPYFADSTDPFVITSPR